jgi:hypothetical protein
MLSHSLAKELKDAGFQHEWCKSDPEKVWCGAPDCLPTLEELIEACGDGFYELHRDTDDAESFCWVAVADNDIPKYQRVAGTYGQNPTEAVARLWLALHANREGGERNILDPEPGATWPCGCPNTDNLVPHFCEAHNQTVI